MQIKKAEEESFDSYRFSAALNKDFEPYRSVQAVQGLHRPDHMS